jgi:hypothetical protein
VELHTVYDLREDTRRIDAIQTATLTTPGYGLRQVPALFASPEWWDKLRTTDLPVITVSGVIDDVYWGSMGDWPECKVRSVSDEVTTWTREGDVSRYVKGLRIEIEYVVQWSKEDAPLVVSGLTSESKIIVSVRIEESNERSNPIAPGPGGVGWR